MKKQPKITVSAEETNRLVDEALARVGNIKSEKIPIDWNLISKVFHTIKKMEEESG
jgi:expansin (peptidoglycan-binding protein)